MGGLIEGGLAEMTQPCAATQLTLRDGRTWHFSANSSHFKCTFDF
jgi:hypothetical protein